jgi:two-component system cell cycle response regulator DivK
MSQRILVVEDQEDNRRIVRDLLSSVGYELIEAVNGEDGVNTAAVHMPDLILMDIQLPGMDGYEAARRIKANPKLQHIPIIAVTSYALSGDDVKAYEAGCNGYVAKNRLVHVPYWRKSVSTYPELSPALVDKEANA